MRCFLNMIAMLFNFNNSLRNRIMYIIVWNIFHRSYYIHFRFISTHTIAMYNALNFIAQMYTCTQLTTVNVSFIKYQPIFLVEINWFFTTLSIIICCIHKRSFLCYLHKRKLVRNLQVIALMFLLHRAETFFISELLKTDAVRKSVSALEKWNYCVKFSHIFVECCRRIYGKQAWTILYFGMAKMENILKQQQKMDLETFQTLISLFSTEE